MIYAYTWARYQVRVYGTIRWSSGFSSPIRTLNAMATYSFLRLIMGKEEIDIFFCLNRDI